MKKKRNNKGFSLVELIVVMAIMAILAVTLAPRIMQYVDKARQANDRELVNNIYTAVKYALVDDTIYATVTSAGTANGSNTEIFLNGGKDHGAETPVATDNPYTITNDGATWTKTTNLDSNKFMYEVLSVMGNFKLQSHEVEADAQIKITVTDQNTFKVQLDYKGDNSYDYELDSTKAS